MPDEPLTPAAASSWSNSAPPSAIGAHRATLWLELVATRRPAVRVGRRRRRRAADGHAHLRPHRAGRRQRLPEHARAGRRRLVPRHRRTATAPRALVSRDDCRSPARRTGCTAACRGSPIAGTPWATSASRSALATRREDFSHFDSMKYWDTARLDLRWARPAGSVATPTRSDRRTRRQRRPSPICASTRSPPTRRRWSCRSVASFAYRSPWLEQPTVRGGRAADGHDRRAPTSAPTSPSMMGNDLRRGRPHQRRRRPGLTGDSTGYATYGLLTQELVPGRAADQRPALPAQTYTIGVSGLRQPLEQKSNADRLASPSSTKR